MPDQNEGLVTYSTDLAKAIAVKSNKYTTRRISKYGRFFALEMTCSAIQM